MLTLTEKAKARLLRALLQHTRDPEKAIRVVLAPCPSTPLGFILDKQEEGDLVITAEDGRTVLLLGPCVGAALVDTMIDYCETPWGAAFTLCKLGPVQ